MKPHSLRCEYQHEPIGLECRNPRLSWKLPEVRRGHRQTAWQLVVADTEAALDADDGAAWDSGRMEGDDCVLVKYAGKPLEFPHRYFWKVRYWDERGRISDWSDVSFWENGLNGAWRNARWIGGFLSGGPRTSVPAPFLRKAFRCGAPVKSARVYVSALGLYTCELNGKPVGNVAMAPGWTDYARRVPYQAYDVSGLVEEGGNTLGLVLGDGWYCGFVAWKGRQLYGDRPKAIAHLIITYADDSTEWIVSDASWKVAYGPILESDLLQGESYDARLEMPGWSISDFDDARWHDVEVFDAVRLAPSHSPAPPVRRIMEIPPVGDPVPTAPNPSPAEGKGYVFDLGQNMTGRIRVKVAAPRGTHLTFRYAEVLSPDGSLYTANLRSAKATDHYTCRGGGEEIWESRFTYHGFRYVEVRGLEGMPPRDLIIGVVLHSDMPVTGGFSCSDPLLNQLQHNIQWGQRGNMLEIPSDCPQRDERLGWTGDAQVFARTAAFNMDVDGFFAKWQIDLADAQFENGDVPSVVPDPPTLGLHEGGPAWSDAVIICPWTMYLCTRDRGILEAHYESMRRFLRRLEDTAEDFIRCHSDSHGWCYGDWLAQDGCSDAFGSTPKDLLGTAFFAYDALLMAKIARILGRETEAVNFDALFGKVRHAFQNRFIHSDGTIAGATQTGYVLALHFQLAAEESRPLLAEKLAEDVRKRGVKLSTGFVGTPYLLHVLSASGHGKLAFELLLQKDWPSWLYAVTHGATTIWERWDGWTDEKGFQTPGMNSFNHYAYGAVGDWIYRNLGGIDLDENDPGYKTIVFRPRPFDGLDHARVRKIGSFGSISCSWRKQAPGLELEVVIPANSRGILHFPENYCRDVTESGSDLSAASGVEIAQNDADALILRLESGSYRFVGVRIAD